MIGVFLFSEDEQFLGIADRVHLFADEQSALEWQIATLVALGMLIDCGDDMYIMGTHEDEDATVYLGKVDALEAFQNTCSCLEFCHACPVEDHREFVFGATS